MTFMEEKVNENLIRLLRKNFTTHSAIIMETCFWIKRWKRSYLNTYVS